ncbi:MAG: hypothetical protein WCG31_09435, partial [Deltaproteobacteria bacterium]
GTQNVYALGQLVGWANNKYGLQLTTEELQGQDVEQIRQRLLAESRRWLLEGRLEEEVRQQLGGDPSVEQTIEYVGRRFDTELKAEDFDGDVTGKAIEVGRSFLRREMSALAQTVSMEKRRRSRASLSRCPRASSSFAEEG